MKIRRLVIVPGVVATVAGALMVAAVSAAGDLTVNTTADTDDGACEDLVGGDPTKDCTLREAINAANADAAKDTIRFDDMVDDDASPGDGVFTINPATAHPAITSPVNLDGATVPGYSSSPVVEINGSGTVAGPDSIGGCVGRRPGIAACQDPLVLVADGLLFRQHVGSEVNAIAVTGFEGNGIDVLAVDGFRITNSYLGLSPNGDPSGNAGTGMLMRSSSGFVVGIDPDDTPGCQPFDPDAGTERGAVESIID